MSHKLAMLLAAVCLTALSMVGCYDSVDITWYEPGEYKGPRDPLLRQLENPNLQKQLDERIREIQTDR